jgi:hypothetical protein
MIKNKFLDFWKNIGRSLNGNRVLKWAVAISFLCFLISHTIRFIIYPLFLKETWHIDSWQEDLYELSTGIAFDILLSVMFYYLLVYIPERRKKTIIKNNFKKNLAGFKERVLVLFMEAAVVQEPYDTKKLSDIHAFKKFFHDRWPEVCKGLTANPILLRKVIKELTFLRGEIGFVLGRIEITEEAYFNQLHHASYCIYHYEDVEAGTEEAKHLCNFLWQMFSGYNWMTGTYPEKDLLAT